MTTHTIKTRSKAPFMLVGVEYGEVATTYPFRRPALGIFTKGYAHSKSEAVMKRARRIGAYVLPIVGGKVEVEIVEGRVRL